MIIWCGVVAGGGRRARMEVAAERAAAAAATKLQRSKRARLEVWRRACCRATAADDVTSEGRCGGPPVVTPPTLLTTRGGIYSYDDNGGTSYQCTFVFFCPCVVCTICRAALCVDLFSTSRSVARKGDSGPTKKAVTTVYDNDARNNALGRLPPACGVGGVD